MKHSLLIFCFVLAFFFLQSICQNISQMSIEQLENQRKIIEQQLSLHEQPWRWYHIVGIGIAILVGFNCVKCCFPFCLALCCGCGVFLIAIIQDLLGKNNGPTRPQDLGYAQDKGKQNQTTDGNQEENNSNNSYGYQRIQEDKENMYPDLDKELNEANGNSNKYD